MRRLAQRAVQSRLARQIVEQVGVNISIQLLGAITTFSFVRLLPTHQYAVFALGVSTVNFIAITSDLGLKASMGYFWRSRTDSDITFAERYSAVLRVRLILFSITALIGAGVLIHLMREQDVAMGGAVIVAALVVGLAWIQLLAAMTVYALRLHGDLRPANRAELLGALTRASLALLAFVLLVQEAWFPLASLGSASLITLMLARRHQAPELRAKGKPSRQSVRDVFRYIIPTTPGTVAYAGQDVFVYWLATLSGGSLVVAQTFALGRLAAIFVTINSVMANVIIPRVVNLSDDKHAIRTGLWMMAAMGVFCSGLIGFAALFPDVLLWLLGESYDDLQTPLLLSLATASITAQWFALSQINRAMGWVRWETPMILIQIVVVAAIVPFFHFETATDVLTFNLILSLTWLANRVATFLLGRRTIAA